MIAIVPEVPVSVPVSVPTSVLASGGGIVLAAREAPRLGETPAAGDASRALCVGAGDRASLDACHGLEAAFGNDECGAGSDGGGDGD